MQPRHNSRRSSRPLPAAMILALCAGGVGAISVAPPGVPVQETPALVVLVVVDQLRPDLLDRYEEHFEGGFRRLRAEGRSYRNVTHDHLVTETAPGHATIATGVHPARHGVVSNVWYEARGGEWVAVENVLTADHSVAGRPDLAGAAPAVLLRDGLADWLAASDADAKVVSLGGKPRGAVLLGGRRPGTAVYWFDPGLGAFITSSFYRAGPEPWVEAFNLTALPAFAADSVWESTVPEAARGLSRSDTAAFEGDGVHTAFPHRFESEGDSATGFWGWFATIPELDRATLELAEEAVSALELGADGGPDLLAISLSQTDLVGHSFGPLSREQLDNLLRLDRALGEFLDRLDEDVGEGRYVVALTSDHGAMTVPEAAHEGGRSALRLGTEELRALEATVNEVVAEAGSVHPDQLGVPLAERVLRHEWIARAWSHDELRTTEPADSFDVLARNSFFDGRVTGLLGRFGVTFQPSPGVLPFGYPERGSTHQSGYLHDRQVPLILSGPGVEPGSVTDRAGAVDIAPTLAEILRVGHPDDLDGRPLPLGGS